MFGILQTLHKKNKLKQVYFQTALFYLIFSEQMFLKSPCLMFLGEKNCIEIPDFNIAKSESALNIFKEKRNRLDHGFISIVKQLVF